MKEGTGRYSKQHTSSGIEVQQQHTTGSRGMWRHIYSFYTAGGPLHRGERVGMPRAFLSPIAVTNVHASATRSHSSRRRRSLAQRVWAPIWHASCEGTGSDIGSHKYHSVIILKSTWFSSQTHHLDTEYNREVVSGSRLTDQSPRGPSCAPWTSPPSSSPVLAPPSPRAT